MTLGPILGFRVRVHLGWALLVLLIVATVAPWLSSPTAAAGLSVPEGVVVGLVVAALLFVSVLAHELAHAIVARRRGMRVVEISMGALAGSTSTDLEARNPATEALVAAAGPLLSGLIGAICLGIGLLIPQEQGGIAIGSVRWVLLITGVGNLLLAVVSLVPAFPMDGGRLVRAIAWAVIHDQVRATRVTSLLGRLIGYVAIFGGFLLAIGGSTTRVVAGLWVVVIGWFLTRAARASYNRVRLEQLTEGMKVSDALVRDVQVVGPNLTLDTLMQQYEQGGTVAVYPVTEDGGLVGAVELSRVAKVPRGKLATTRVTDVMRRAETMITFNEPDPLMAAVERFEQTGADAFPVVDGEDPRRLLGLVTRDSVLRLMRSRAARLQGAR
jgi:Zn-dependent protease